jgi:hypothetical protein
LGDHKRAENGDILVRRFYVRFRTAGARSSA